MPVTITCLHCGKSTKVPPSRARRQFCNQACRSAHTHIQKACAVCGKPFKCRRGDQITTCRSEECRKAVHIKPRIEVDCTCGCGNKVSVSPSRQRRSKKFFVNPSHKYMWCAGKNHPRYQGGPAYYGDGWKKVAKSIRERDKVCQMCGKTPEENGRELDVHHIKPVRVSRDNSPENLIALCRSCHLKATVLEEYTSHANASICRKCIYCDTPFLPKPHQRICSVECKHRHVLQYQRELRTRNPEAYQVRLQYNRDWFRANKYHVNEHQREYRKRRKSQ